MNDKRVKLVRPQITHIKLIESYRNEFIKNHEVICGGSELEKYDNINDWLIRIKNNSNEQTVLKGLVPESVFIMLSEDESKMIGIVDIRHRLNENLFNFGGHIGYSIRKSCRMNGYASEMLKLSLNECIKLGLDKVLITCDKDNIGSAKVIEKNGGILENEIVMVDNKEIVQRYWIDVKK